MKAKWTKTCMATAPPGPQELDARIIVQIKSKIAT